MHFSLDISTCDKLASKSWETSIGDHVFRFSAVLWYRETLHPRLCVKYRNDARPYCRLMQLLLSQKGVTPHYLEVPLCHRFTRSIISMRDSWMCTKRSWELAHDRKGWKFPCSSRISPFVSRVESADEHGNFQPSHELYWHWRILSRGGGARRCLNGALIMSQMEREMLTRDLSHLTKDGLTGASHILSIPTCDGECYKDVVSIVSKSCGTDGRVIRHCF